MLQWLVDFMIEFDRSLNILNIYQRVLIENMVSFLVICPMLFMLFFFIRKEDKWFKTKMDYFDFAVLLMNITFFYYVWYFIYVHNLLIQQYPDIILWNPYVFGGTPSYACGRVGVNYWNHIGILLSFLTNTFKNLISLNPLTISFVVIGLFLWLKRVSQWWWYMILLVLITLTLDLEIRI